MAKDHSDEKAKQLGMPYGTARNKLNKLILFSLMQHADMDTCSRCNEKITSVDELSVEHNEAWLHSDDPVGKFFDLGNISFSHHSCNCRAARPYTGERKRVIQERFVTNRKEFLKKRLSQLRKRITRTSEGLRYNSKSGYLGVSIEATGRFRAHSYQSVSVHGSEKSKSTIIGFFATAKEAAIAYDNHVESIDGVYAVTNKALGIL